MNMKIAVKYLSFIAVILVICISLLSYKSEIKEYFTIEKIVKVEVPYEVPVEVKVIEYVEKKIPTDQIILYLNPRVDPTIAKEIGKAVDKYSKEYNLPRNLILGIIHKESTFDPMAKSKVAYGLMQVYPKFHKDKLKKRNIKDLRLIYHIDTNIDIGCEIWKEYYDRSKGDLKETFHKYLSKNATAKHRDYYMNVVYGIWIKIDMHEYKELERMENEKG